MTASLAECAGFLKKIINGLTVNEFLQNNVYCNRIPQSILADLQQRLEKPNLKSLPPLSHDMDDFDLFSNIASKKLFSKSTGSFGSRMLAASKDKSESKGSSFYFGDSCPSYSFASESPLVRPFNHKYPPVMSFLSWSTSLLERKQHEPPVKKVCNSPPMTYSTFRSMKEGSNCKNSSNLILDDPQPSFYLKRFPNLGNTCYMNAILQSLLGLDSFANDLLHYKNIKQLPPKCLFLMIYLLLKGKHGNLSSEVQITMLNSFKKSISTTAPLFSDYSQHDAHEFLAQCLDQLKEDCLSVPKVEDPCPVSQNFECTVEHTTTCLSCGESVKKQEIFQTFSVTIPDQQQSNVPGDHLALQGLLDNFFNEEEVQYACNSCQSKTAKFTHCFLQLPRVLIIHVKCYPLSNTHLSYYKNSNHIYIPKYLNIGTLCADEVVQCPPLPLKPQSSAATKTNCTPSSSLSQSATVNKLLTTPLHSATNKPSRHPLLLDSFRSNGKSDAPSVIPTTPFSSLFKFNKPKTPVADHKMEPQNLANILSTSDHVDNDIPSEEEQLKWALNASKAMMDGHKPVQVEGDDEDDPELTRVLEESRLLFEQQNNNNGISRHTPSSSASPSLLCDNNVTTDSGYFSNNIDLTNDDLLQHKERYNGNSVNLLTTPQRLTPVPLLDNNSAITSQIYQLASVVSHMGGSNPGHYISDVHCPGSSTWMSYNDSTGTRISEVEVRQRCQTSGNIFFYVNKSILQLNK